MCQITKHACRRYVERIKGISDQRERDAYISENQTILYEHINKMFDHSEFIYRGQIGGDKTTKDFYIHQDICFVVSNDSRIITIFKIIFSFTEELNPVIREELIKKIKELKIKIEEETEKTQEERWGIDVEIDQNSKRIKELYLEIDILKSKNKMLEEEKSMKTNGICLLNSERDRIAEQLFGNTEYKKDVDKI